MPDDDRAALKVFMTRETLATETVLIGEGEAPRMVYFPLTLIVSRTANMSGGRVSEGPFVGLETGIGLLDAMEEHGRSTRLVRLAGDCISIPSDVFRRRVLGSGQLALLMFRDAAAQLERTEQFARCGLIHDGQSRTARAILELEERIGRPSFNVTQAQLAAFVGATRTSVNGYIAFLKRARLVTYSGREITVQDRSG